MSRSLHYLCGSGLLLVYLLCVNACEAHNDPGRMSVTFEFADAPDPAVEYWVSASVTADGGATTLSAQAPLSWSAGEALGFRFQGVENGAGRVVRVEFRRSPDPAQRVELFGVSAPFEIRPGLTTAVTVRVQIRTPSASTGNALAIAIDGTAVEDLIDPRRLGDVKVVATTVSAAVIEVSNDPDLRDSLLIDVASPPSGVVCESVLVDAGTATRCIVESWNLLVPDPTPPGGAFTVYAIFRDSEGYPSSPEVARVRGDIYPPVLLASTVSPPARDGDIVAVSITASEAVEPPTLTLKPSIEDDTWEFVRQPSADQRTWRWVSTRVNSGQREPDELETYTFSTSLTDLRGNMAAAPNLQLLGENGALLELIIDNEPPGILATATLEFADGRVAAFSPSQRSFPVNGTSIARFEGTAHDVGGISSFEGAISGFDLECEAVVTADGPTLTCLYDPANNNPGFFPLGAAPLTLTAVDAAGNLTIVTVGTLLPDYLPPALATEPFYTISDFGLRVVRGPNNPAMHHNASLEIVLVFDEALGRRPELKVDGISSAFVASTWETGDSVATFQLSFLFMEPGARMMRVTVTDVAGNTGEIHIGDLIIIP